MRQAMPGKLLKRKIQGTTAAAAHTRGNVSALQNTMTVAGFSELPGASNNITDNPAGTTLTNPTATHSSDAAIRIHLAI